MREALTPHVAQLAKTVCHERTVLRASLRSGTPPRGFVLPCAPPSAPAGAMRNRAPGTAPCGHVAKTRGEERCGDDPAHKIDDLAVPRVAPCLLRARGAIHGEGCGSGESRAAVPSGQDARDGTTSTKPGLDPA
jgi:hypothetical protein